MTSRNRPMDNWENYRVPDDITLVITCGECSALLLDDEPCPQCGHSITPRRSSR